MAENDPRTAEGAGHHLAYVFERFPTATQTFCIREILELENLGLRPLIFSIRDTSEEEVKNWPADLRDRVVTLPQGKALGAEVRQLKADGELPQSLVLVLRHWGERPDKQRVYEAAWIGHHLAQHHSEIQHAHCHFAGVAARTLWWLRRFHGLTYSITGHANDLFCDPGDVHPQHEQLLEDASMVPTVSEFTADWIRENLPRGANRVCRAYNGLDLGPFDGKAGGIGKSPPVILSVGRLIEKKGFPDLIDACALLIKDGLQLECRIIGDGPMEEELTEQIRNLGLERSIKLLGVQPISEIVRQMEEETALFALPCMVESDGGMDNLPTVIMEAMAAGLPVVSTRLAGVPEMVEEGHTGALVDPGDVTGLAQSMRSYFDDPEKSRAHGAAGRTKCEETFASPVTATRLLQLLVSKGRTRIDQRIAQHLTGSHRRGNLLFRLRERFHRLPKARDKGFDLARFLGR